MDCEGSGELLYGVLFIALSAEELHTPLTYHSDRRFHA